MKIIGIELGHSLHLALKCIVASLNMCVMLYVDLLYELPLICYTIFSVTQKILHAESAETSPFRPKSDGVAKWIENNNNERKK